MVAAAIYNYTRALLDAQERGSLESILTDPRASSIENLTRWNGTRPESQAIFRELARRILHAADACLAQVKPNEPIFVLRGQDALAPSAVRAWAMGVHGAHCMSLPPELEHVLHSCPIPKVIEALALADEMDDYPDRKLPD
jgi:hypothetical protein